MSQIQPQQPIYSTITSIQITIISFVLQQLPNWSAEFHSFPPKAGSPHSVTALFQCDPQLKIQAKPNAYKPLQDQAITYLSYTRTLLFAHLAPAMQTFFSVP